MRELSDRIPGCIAYDMHNRKMVKHESTSQRNCNTPLERNTSLAYRCALHLHIPSFARMTLTLWYGAQGKVSLGCLVQLNPILLVKT